MWDVYKAKAWMLKTGMDHIQSRLFIEGAELIYESKWGDGCNTIDNFIAVLDTVLWWDSDMIEDTLHELKITNVI